MSRIHFLGIAGTAMATVACMLKARGDEVQGSDHAVYPPMSDLLAREGIRVFDGYAPANVGADVDLVVVGNAISRGNPELESVLDRHIRYVSLPELIRDRFVWGSRSIVIAGTHGKTTTTSMVGWMLTSAGRDPSVLIGGIAANFGQSFRLGCGGDFVVEGDEYDSAYFDKTAKFLKYLPGIAVVGNVEYDHADIYPDMASLRTAFRRLLGLVPGGGLTVLGIDSPEAADLAAHARSPVTTFATTREADWRATDIRVEPERTVFDVRRHGEPFGAFEIRVAGEHNVRNALATMAVGAEVGLDLVAIQEGLRTFRGVKRRLELRGVERGVAVYDDFAHHPTAIEATIRALRAAHPGARVWAVFEPRSATSCRRVFQADFARAFVASGADEVVIAPVFRTALPPAERLSVEDVVGEIRAAGGRARTIAGTDAIVRTIADEARSGDLIVAMSNGGFEGIHDALLAELAGRPVRTSSNGASAKT